MARLIPTGNSINVWPKPLNSPEQQGIASTALQIDQQVQARNAANAQIISMTTATQYRGFYLAHFGVNAPQEIAKLFLRQETAGPEGFRSLRRTQEVAQEILQYKTPSPEAFGIDINHLTMVVELIHRSQNHQQTIDKKSAEIKPLLEPAIFTLNVRPSPVAFIAWRETPLTSFTDKTVAGQGYSTDGQRSATTRLSQGVYNANSLPEGSQHFYGFTGQLGSFEKKHPSGFTIDGFQILDYYNRAYSRTPAYFWEWSAKHRIMHRVNPMEPNKILASVFEVDPATGAISGGKEYIVAHSTNSNDVQNPNYFLSQVKSKLFPEVYLMEDGITLDSEDRYKHYSSELREAVNTWTAMPEKSQTPIAVVMSQQFNWNPADPSTGLKPGPKTTPPISTMRVMIQPTGIEKAMKKILDLNHPGGNAIEKWFTTNHVPNTMTMGATKEYKYTKGTISKEDFQRLYVNPYYVIMGELYRTLGDPYIYQNGVYHYLGQYPNDPTKQALVQIFQYADWPQGKPQELFSAPFDDQRDANRIMAMLKRAFGPMGFGDGIMPPIMGHPESFNGKLSYRVQIQSGVGQSTEQGGISNVEYKFTRGTDAMTTYRRTKVYPRMFASGYTQNNVLSTEGAKSILSKTDMGSNALPNMPVQIDPKPQTANLFGDNLDDMQKGAGIGVVVTIVGIVGLIGASLFG